MGGGSDRTASNQIPQNYQALLIEYHPKLVERERWAGVGWGERGGVGGEGWGRGGEGVGIELYRYSQVRISSG